MFLSTAVLAGWAGSLAPAQAQTAPRFSVLHEFAGGADGDGTAVALVTDSAGEVYGVSGTAGTATACASGPCGAIFSLTPPVAHGSKWTFTTLYSLNGVADGAKPAGDEITLAPDGSLYGTAALGGSAAYPSGGGVVWHLTPPTPPSTTWTYAVVHAFTPGSDAAGANPLAGLALSSTGVLYGSTTTGGANGSGTIFSLTPPAPPSTTWTEAVLHDFPAEHAASDSLRALKLSHDEKRLFGTTAAGGAGYAYELRLVKGAWKFRLIAKFKAGQVSFSNLIDDSHRNVFGAVTQGGAFGFGETFELVPPASGGGLWAIMDLVDYGAAMPHAPVGPLVQGNGPKGSDGPLFGTLGGTGNLVYRLSPPVPPATAWTYSVVRQLDGTSNGTLPPDGVYAGLGGDLLGAATSGGTKKHGLIYRQQTKAPAAP